jgi:FeS assembly SUF system protein
MNDETPKPQPTHLPVLPHSGKVDQLRKEAAMSSEQPAPAHPVEDRAAEATPPASSGKSIEDKLLEGKVIAALSSVYDPEIPVNIYELGLIYKIDIDAERNVNITMTLTAPACPVAGTLPGEVEKRVEAVPEVKSASVELVWDPPWSRDRMSESALLALGMM